MNRWATLSPEKEKAQGLSGQFLTFYMQDEEYGIEIRRVQEIIQMLSVTPIPRTMKFVKGVVNLRGQVIPVIDLRVKLEMTAAFNGDQTCIIIVDVNGMNVGVIIDQVSDVIDLKEHQIDRTPSFGARLNTEFIRGIGKHDEKVTVLIDIEKILLDSEFEALCQFKRYEPNNNKDRENREK